MLGGQAEVSERKPGRTRSKRPLSRVTGEAARGLTGWLDGNDKRGPVARRFRDLCTEITGDLGGPAGLSESQRQIIRRIASMSVWCESEEAKMADGKEVNIDQFQRTSNSLRRLCESIGLERRSADVTETWDEYLARTARKGAQDAQEGGDG
jgi:hypothetical protein